MTVETATYISQLSATLPLATDPISQGDDHIRLIKEVLQAQFSGLSGTTAVTTSGSEMNILDGVTATSTELNYLDITTLGTSEASKVVTADANGDVTIADGAYDFDVASHDGTNGLLLGGTLVTASATELNLIDGYTGTTAELNTLDVTTQGTAEASKAVTMSSGSITNFADKVLQRPEIKDYGETVNAIGGTGGGTQSIDLTLGNVVTATQDTSATTYTFDNPSPTGKGCAFTFILTNGASNSGTVWPASVDWAGGTEPTLTTAGIDIFTFITIDEGTIWYGFTGGLDMKTPS